MLITCDDGKKLQFDVEHSDIFEHNAPIEIVDMNLKYATLGKPGTKSNTIFTLLIQFGLSCNYSCGYCSQRYLPFDESENLKDSSLLLEKIKTLNLSGAEVQLWGGEPLIYWKTIKKFVPALRKFFNGSIQITTNGSLLNDEKVEWCIENTVMIAVSHDGPSQKVRSPDDILDNPNIVKCIENLTDASLMTFNPTIYKQNQSRVAIFDFFQNRFGDKFSLANAEMIRPYDLATRKFCLNTTTEHYEYRNLFLKELLESPEKLSRFCGVRRKFGMFALHFGQHTITKSVPAHCGVDQDGFLTLDLKGNILECMNSNKIMGHIDTLDKTEVKIQHWSERANCSKCPIVSVCAGTCPIMEGEYHYGACEADYSDIMPLWAVFVKHKYGSLPIYIDADLPEIRRDLWGRFDTPKKHKSIIPILQK